MTRLPLACVFATSLGLALAATHARAVELSDLKVDFTDTGVDPDAAGSLRLRATGGQAVLQIKLRNVDANPVYLCAGADAVSLRRRAQLDSSGGTLSSNDELDFDPRGKLLAVANAEDCAEAALLLTATLDEPATCAPGGKGVKIHERAALDQGTATDPASAELVYHLLPDRNCKFASSQEGQPRRKARLSVQTKHADARTDYAVCIDDVRKGVLSTNAAGVGRADFTFNQPKGNGHGNPKRAVIDFDAYASKFEIRDDGDCSLDDQTAVFWGSLLAPLCAAEEFASVTLAPPLSDPLVSGEAVLGRDRGCARVFEVSAQGLPDGDYDLVVGDMLKGTFAVVGGAGAIAFSSDPGIGGALLDFDPSGQLVEVLEAGTPNVALSGMLP
jgi:hypothetical protein